MTRNIGVRWNPLSSPTKETLTKIIQANDTYYVTGMNGLIMASKDGKNWTKQPNIDSSDLFFAIENNGKIYVMGAYGTVISADLKSLKWVE
jgi:hypothetical protein